MSSPSAGEELKVHRVSAYNFAEESDNKIHSDETAARYGFKGGLVPGVAVYGYMTIPIVEALGREWLERGTLTAKFIKPVYDGETVEIRATTAQDVPLRIGIEVVNPEGTLCAVGEAGWRVDEDTIDRRHYPWQSLPPEDKRLPPVAESIPQGLVLGSVDFTFDRARMQDELLPDFREPLTIYRGEEGLCHPALISVKGNRSLVRNVALGPWIHTASQVVHYGIPRDGEALSMRGKVAESYEKRGHQFAVIDLALLGEGDRLLATNLHTAIVRPAG